MGRKKRKTDNAEDAPVLEDPPSDPSLSKDSIRIPKKEHHSAVVDVPLCVPVNINQPPPQPILIQSLVVPKMPLKVASKAAVDKNANADTSLAGGTKASGYAMTSHSADLITEDIYVSDGSEDEDEMENSDPLELNLTSSKMGLMRRGLGHSAIYQPKTWVRPTTETEKKTDENGQDIDGDGDGDEDMKESKDEEENLELMDPVQRAAYLLVEKQKKLEEATELQRKMESAENAGRDPCLFSKRTAFDIRMDQIEEKPWDRNAGGGGDISDYFNYGMAELDWVEYSEQQKIVRQELTDASRQRRNPDPTIVPVVPKTPSRQAPRVAVATKKADDDSDDDDDVEMSNVAVGPTLPVKEIKAEDKDNENGDSEKNSETKDDATDASVSVKAESSSGTGSVAASVSLVGGAWGAPPGSKLAKLIEEQENRSNAPPPPIMHQMPPGPPPPQHRNEWGNPGRGDDRYQHGRGGGGGGRGRGNYHQQQNHDQGSYQPNHFQQQDFSAPPPPHGNWHGRPNQHQQQHERYPPNNFQQDFSAPPPPNGNFHGGGRGGRGRGPPPGRGFGGRGNWRPRY